jgi:hypothetical protein
MHHAVRACGSRSKNLYKTTDYELMWLPVQLCPCMLAAL